MCGQLIKSLIREVGIDVAKPASLDAGVSVDLAKDASDTAAREENLRKQQLTAGAKGVFAPAVQQAGKKQRKTLLGQ
jgi:hypothetical protein